MTDNPAPELRTKIPMPPLVMEIGTPHAAVRPPQGPGSYADARESYAGARLISDSATSYPQPHDPDTHAGVPAFVPADVPPGAHAGVPAFVLADPDFNAGSDSEPPPGYAYPYPYPYPHPYPCPYPYPHPYAPAPAPVPYPYPYPYPGYQYPQDSQDPQDPQDPQYPWYPPNPRYPPNPLEVGQDFDDVEAKPFTPNSLDDNLGFVPDAGAFLEPETPTDECLGPPPQDSPFTSPGGRECRRQSFVAGGGSGSSKSDTLDPDMLARDCNIEIPPHTCHIAAATKRVTADVAPLSYHPSHPFTTQTAAADTAQAAQQESSWAEQQARENLEIRMEVLGDDHPLTAVALNTLAGVLMKQGKMEEVEALMKQALAISEKEHGVFQPSTPNVLYRAINLRINEAGEKDLIRRVSEVGYKEQLARLNPTYSKRLVSQAENLGPLHNVTLSTTHSLASIMCQAGRSEEAMTLVSSTWMAAKTELELGEDSSQSQALLQLYIHIRDANAYADKHNPLKQKAKQQEQALLARGPRPSRKGQHLRASDPNRVTVKMYNQPEAAVLEPPSPIAGPALGTKLRAMSDASMMTARANLSKATGTSSVKPLAIPTSDRNPNKQLRSLSQAQVVLPAIDDNLLGLHAANLSGHSHSHSPVQRTLGVGRKGKHIAKNELLDSSDAGHTVFSVHSSIEGVTHLRQPNHDTQLKQLNQLNHGSFLSQPRHGSLSPGYRRATEDNCSLRKPDGRRASLDRISGAKPTPMGKHNLRFSVPQGASGAKPTPIGALPGGVKKGNPVKSPARSQLDLPPLNHPPKPQGGSSGTTTLAAINPCPVRTRPPPPHASCSGVSSSPRYRLSGSGATNVAAINPSPAMARPPAPRGSASDPPAPAASGSSANSLPLNDGVRVGALTKPSRLKGIFRPNGGLRSLFSSNPPIEDPTTYQVERTSKSTPEESQGLIQPKPPKVDRHGPHRPSPAITSDLNVARLSNEDANGESGLGVEVSTPIGRALKFASMFGTRRKLFDPSI
eukprot:gene22948-30132_t